MYNLQKVQKYVQMSRRIPNGDGCAADPRRKSPREEHVRNESCEADCGKGRCDGLAQGHGGPPCQGTAPASWPVARAVDGAGDQSGRADGSGTDECSRCDRHAEAAAACAHAAEVSESGPEQGTASQSTATAFAETAATLGSGHDGTGNYFASGQAYAKTAGSQAERQGTTATATAPAAGATACAPHDRAESSGTSSTTASSAVAAALRVAVPGEVPGVRGGRALGEPLQSRRWSGWWQPTCSSGDTADIGATADLTFGADGHAGVNVGELGEARDIASTSQPGGSDREPCAASRPGGMLSCPMRGIPQPERSGVEMHIMSDKVVQALPDERGEDNQRSEALQAPVIEHSTSSKSCVVKGGTQRLLAENYRRCVQDAELLGVNVEQVHDKICNIIETEMLEEMNKVQCNNTVLHVVADGGSDVVEVFSQVEAVKRAGARRGLRVGDSMSQEFGFDFKKVADRNRAFHRITTDKPFLIVLAFPCSIWSSIQNLRKANEKDLLGVLREEERVLLRFVRAVCEIQVKNNRHFLLENPAGSMAWKEPDIAHVVSNLSVDTCISHMCRFNKKNASGKPLYKPTRFSSSSQCVIDNLKRRCESNHVHGHVMVGDRTASAAAGEYSKELAEAIITGLVEQKELDRSHSACPVEQDEQEQFDLFDLGKRKRLTKSGFVRNTAKRYRERTNKTLVQNPEIPYVSKIYNPKVPAQRYQYGKQPTLTPLNRAMRRNDPRGRGFPLLEGALLAKHNPASSSKRNTGQGEDSSDSRPPAVSGDDTRQIDEDKGDTDTDYFADLDELPELEPSDIEQGSVHQEPTPTRGKATASVPSRKPLDRVRAAIKKWKPKQDKRSPSLTRRRTTAEGPESGGAGMQEDTPAESPADFDVQLDGAGRPRDQEDPPAESPIDVSPVGDSLESRRLGDVPMPAFRKNLIGTREWLEKAPMKMPDPSLLLHKRPRADPDQHRSEHKQSKHQRDEDLDPPDAEMQSETDYGSQHETPETETDQDYQADPRLQPESEEPDDPHLPLEELQRMQALEAQELAPSAGPAPPTGVFQAVKRLHNNLGHPEAKTLIRALRTCGASEDAVEAAKRLRCDVCYRMHLPSTRRPSQLPRATVFNELVAVDLFWVTDCKDDKYTILNIVDCATRFQVCTPCRSKRPDDVLAAMESAWFCWAGPPDRLQCDLGGEFHREFGDFMEATGVTVSFSGTQAPWQNGLAERHGGAWKLAFNHSVRANSVVGLTQVRTACIMCNWAKNSRVNASGFSPSQWVLGRGMRMPWSLLNGASRLAELSKAETDPVFSQRLGLLSACKRAFEVLDSNARLRRAWLARSRLTPTAVSLPVGSMVYIHRKVRPTKGAKLPLLKAQWHGPAYVIGHEGACIWCSYRGTCTKCAAEHVRKASPEEMMAFEALPHEDRFLMEALFKGQTKGLQYADFVKTDSLRDFQDDHLINPPSHDQYQQPAAPAAPAVPDAQAEGQQGPTGAQDSVMSEPTTPQEPATPVDDVITPAAEPSPSVFPDGPTVGGYRTAVFPDVPPIGRMSGEEATRQLLIVDAERRQRMGLPPRQGGPTAPILVSDVPDDAGYGPLRSRSNRTVVARSDPSAQVSECTPDPAVDRLFDALCGGSVFSGARDLDAHAACAAVAAIRESRALAATARRERRWSQFSPEEKKLYIAASDKHWQRWLDNDAAEVILPKEAAVIKQQLQKDNATDRILQMRHLFTDKNDGKRTEQNPLPIDANDRLLVPGYQDPDLLELRRDAPTAGQHSQNLLFLVGSSVRYRKWRIASSDISGAFLKGDQQTRLLYAHPPQPWSGPPLKGVPPGSLIRLAKGVFGLNDAPRLWWTRLRDFLLKQGCRQSRLDPSLFMLEVDGVLEGLLTTHVDDILSVGSERMTDLLRRMDKEFGFGSQEFDSFRHTGKQVRKDMATGCIHVSMPAYAENLEQVKIPRTRRTDAEGELAPQELKTLRTVNGGLQWLQRQLRPDLSFAVSVSQGATSDARVKHLVEVQKVVTQAKKHKDFELVYRPLDLDKGGFLSVSDAGLGGIGDDGDYGTVVDGKVRSQGGYLVLFGDENLAHHGTRGQFNLLDWRSHKLKRVCRSSFAAETLSLADANDAVQHLRGSLLEILDPKANLKEWESQVSRWPATLVVDARDCFDHLNKETSALPSQKALMFDLAAIRGSINEGHTKMRWTATENMLADCLTKPMDPDHLIDILTLGEWSVAYDSQLVNPAIRSKRSTVSTAAGSSAP